MNLIVSVVERYHPQPGHERIMAPSTKFVVSFSFLEREQRLIRSPRPLCIFPLFQLLIHLTNRNIGSCDVGATLMALKKYMKLLLR